MRLRNSRAIGEGNQGAAQVVLTCLVLLSSLLVPPAASQEQTGREPCPSSQTTQPPQPWTPAPDCIDVQILSPATVAPKVGDRADGLDTAFRFTATVSHPPEGSELEAFIVPSTGPPISLGKMTRVAPDSDTWELFWSVPDAEARGTRTLSVVLTADEVRVADDQMTVDLAHKSTPASGSTCGVPGAPGCTPAAPEAETASLTWPLQDGALGFYRAADGLWRTVIDASVSAGATGTMRFYYSVSPIGLQPSFTECGTAATVVKGEHRVASGICTLGDGLLPSLVTAVAAVPSVSALESGDAVRVHPYIQDTDSMSIALDAMDPATITRGYPSGTKRRLSSGCLRYSVKVSDALERPVVGANVDVSISGPNDAVAFGSAADASTFGAPPNLTNVAASTCSGLGNSTSKQALTVVPDGPDVVQIESTLGTGLSGPAGVGTGEWRFLVFGAESGRTNIKAWIDDVRVLRETDLRRGDDDSFGSGEKVATNESQWFTSDINLAITPTDSSEPAWGCAEHRVIVQAGGSKVQGLNIDLHARGPKNDLAFCSLPGHDPVRPPDLGEHTGPLSRDGIGASHPATHAECGGTSDTLGTVCRHAEGETNSDGELVFGLVSSSAGDSTVEAWVEGDRGLRFDVDTRSTTIRAASTVSWAKSPEDVEVRLISPSAFTGGTSLASTPVGGPIRVTARVDQPAFVQRMEVLLGSGGSYNLLGYAEQVGLTDTWQFDWDLTDAAGQDVSDGTYDLLVRLEGTNQSATRSITIDRKAPTATAAGKPEWVRLTSPGNARPLAFKDGAATIEGLASPGAEGVDLYYSIGRTRQGTSTTNNIVWQSTMCGYVDLLGTGTQDQPFLGKCQLAAGHNPSDVIAVSALTFDCSLRAGCDADPNPKPVAGSVNNRPRQGENAGAAEGGEAIRVRGCGGTTCAWISPGSARRSTGDCHAVALDLFSADGGPLTDTQVDVEIAGPSGSVEFCDPSIQGGPTNEPPSTRRSGTARLEAATDGNGSLVLGVRSADASFASIFDTVEFGHTRIKAWPDLDGDDQAGAGEPVVTARVHWELADRCTIVGSSLDDSLAGTVDADKICVLDGVDEVIAQEGDDVILAGLGNDILVGDEGNDILYGEQGIDEIEGGVGDDELYGGGGSDKLVGNAGNDLIVGGRGRDICVGGKGRDTFIGCEVIEDLGKKDTVENRKTRVREEVPPNVI